MEKYISFIKIGIKYLLRYKRRYYFLLSALIFGFAIITFITSSKDGMYDSAYYSAQSHYAGDIIAIAHDFNPNGSFLHRMGTEEINSIVNTANVSDLNIQNTVYRTLGIGSPVILHAGNSVNLRYLMGCDFKNEDFIFNKMNFLTRENEIEEDGIIISEPVAQKLQANMGDRIILELDTRHGQKNTGVFIIQGIIKDTSIFGYYKAYVPRITLNRLLLYADDDCSQVGFFLEDSSKAEKQRMLLQNSLASHIQTGPIVYNRDQMVQERDKDWQGNVIFLYTLPVYLSEIADILNAMNLLTYLLFIMMLITILASAGVTYNLILNERSREMGVMRAIGFHGFDMHVILWTEVIIITVISIIFGFIFSCLLSFTASFISFSWFPGFEIFLKGDKLIPMYVVKTITSNILMVLIVVILMVLYHSKKITNKKLPALLSGEPL